MTTLVSQVTQAINLLQADISTNVNWIILEYRNLTLEGFLHKTILELVLENCLENDKNFPKHSWRATQ